MATLDMRVPKRYFGKRKAPSFGTNVKRAGGSMWMALQTAFAATKANKTELVSTGFVSRFSTRTQLIFCPED